MFQMFWASMLLAQQQLHSGIQIRLLCCRLQPAAVLRVAILSIYFTGVVRRVVRNTPNAALAVFRMLLVLDRITRLYVSDYVCPPMCSVDDVGLLPLFIISFKDCGGYGE
jgi:hypothetical protein